VRYGYPSQPPPQRDRLHEPTLNATVMTADLCGHRIDSHLFDACSNLET
jgi:hypothetical protein